MMANNEIISWIKANPVKSALILLAIGIGFYIIDSGISSANRAKNLIINHASKINKEGGKLKAEVSARIDGVQKAFKEIDAITERFRFDKKLRDENDSFQKGQSINARYESKRQEIFTILSHNESMLKNIKANIDKEKEQNHEFAKKYIDFPEYRRLIVTIYENIAYTFDENGFLLYFHNCEFFTKNLSGSKVGCVISEEYSQYNRPLERKQEIENLVKKLGDIYLTTSADERANKTQVIYNYIKKTYFTEVEEDWGVRWARSYGDYAAKALLPYKAFIEEIINAQRHIDGTEAQEYLKENAWGRCIERNSKYDIKNKTRSRKRVEELKNNFPWKEKNTAFGRAEKHDCDRCQDDIDGTGILNQGKSSVTQYNLLENQTSVRVLLRLMETNKDFGVKDDE
jgi:hypothetical protein